MASISSALAGIAVSMLAKLVTETFLARLVIEGLRAWAKQTANEFDDRLVEEAAKAFGIPPETLKETIRTVNE